MKQKFIWVIVCLVVIGAAGFFSLKTGSDIDNRAHNDGDIHACTMEAKICPDGSSVGRSGPNCEFAECPTGSTSTTNFTWSFTEEKETADGVPHTSVTFGVNGKKYPLGSYEGSCSEISGSSWKLLAGEKAGAICYFAGGGTELGIFEENGGLVVKKGDLSEGDNETPSVRGNFKLFLKLQ